MSTNTEYKKNDSLTVVIEDMGNDGEGIGKVDGFTIFVKDALIGDTVQVKIMKSKKHYAYAKLEKVLTPSPFRIQPKCEFHKQCGGCQIQALSYEKQLEFKQQKVRNHLIRLGGFAPESIDAVMEPIVGMDDIYHYRNKAQYPVGYDKEGNLITGFYAGRTHSIIANTDCCLGMKGNQVILETILQYMKDNQVTAYEEQTGTGLVRHILIRIGFHSKQVMVCLVINREKMLPASKKSGQAGKKPKEEYLPNQSRLIEALSHIPNMTSVSVNLNTSDGNVIMGKETDTLWGSPTIEDTIRICDVRTKQAEEGTEETEFLLNGQELVFKISPLSFYQVNPRQTEKLYSLALDYANLQGNEVVWDLYCGIGTISLFMATRAKQVYGVEIIPQAILDAKENAHRNQLHNVEFFVGKAEEVLPEKYEAEGIAADVIVVDPPRKGCDSACLATMLKMHPNRIVYVSCDSATLARDLKILCDGGYELKRVRAVDQFGHTVHVECVVLIQKRCM